VLNKLQRWFVAGLFLIAPTYITVVVLLWLFSHLDAPMRSLVAGIFPPAAVPGIGVLATLVLIMAAGAFASTFISRALFGAVERMLLGIPVVRTVYSGIKQLLSPFSPEESAQLQRVVVVEWPGDGLYSLGFLVKPNACVGPDGVMMGACLLPSNHLHLGNVVLIPDDRIFPVDMTIEEGLKFLVSMGAALDRPFRLDLKKVPIAKASGA
jgi:uncharacterized membrane protein